LQLAVPSHVERTTVEIQMGPDVVAVQDCWGVEKCQGECTAAERAASALALIGGTLRFRLGQSFGAPRQVGCTFTGAFEGEPKIRLTGAIRFCCACLRPPCMLARGMNYRGGGHPMHHPARKPRHAIFHILHIAYIHHHTTIIHSLHTRPEASPTIINHAGTVKIVLSGQELVNVAGDHPCHQRIRQLHLLRPHQLLRPRQFQGHSSSVKMWSSLSTVAGALAGSRRSAYTA
jgi:hypothetical protein